MSRYHSYISNTCKILETYDGAIPFAIFVKHFFSKEKKFGSSDRKTITNLCYNFFRVGIILNRKINEENLLIAFFLCNNKESSLLEQLKPEWNKLSQSSLQEKISSIKKDINLENLFPFKSELSESIDSTLFSISFLSQPALYLRIRPGKYSEVINKLSKAKTDFKTPAINSIQLSPATKIENVLLLDQEVVIQDLNSQQVLNYLSDNNQQIKKDKDLQIWDTCAASGGKSILLTDTLQTKFNLTVSDIRSSIINNLRERFAGASIKNYNCFIADLTKSATIKNLFDIIICDAPCTGSGTWSRTPEQLYFFTENSIDEFSSLQKKIVSNTIPNLKANGLFFYITCSVFKKENEDVVSYIKEELRLELMEMKTLTGYTIKADSMFVAIFKNTTS